MYISGLLVDYFHPSIHLPYCLLSGLGLQVARRLRAPAGVNRALIFYFYFLTIILMLLWNECIITHILVSFIFNSYCKQMPVFTNEPSYSIVPKHLLMMGALVSISCVLPLGQYFLSGMQDASDLTNSRTESGKRKSLESQDWFSLIESLTVFRS